MRQGAASTARERILDPMDRISEWLFGLIMVLTFTCTLSAFEAERADVRTMFFGALGCNLAWGIIDGVMYLMDRFAERARGLRTLREVRESTDTERTNRIIAGAFPENIAASLSEGDFDALRGILRDVPLPEQRRLLTRSDWMGALGLCLIVFVGVFPVLIPFIFVQQVHLAMRISNAIALTMLFTLGWFFGRLVGRSQWIVGFSMMLGGAIMVGITIALGG